MTAPNVCRRLPIFALALGTGILGCRDAGPGPGDPPGVDATPAADGEDLLRLEQVGATIVPAGANVTGLIVLSASSVVAWEGRSSVWAVDLPEDEWMRLGGDTLYSPIGAGRTEDDAIEVIDSAIGLALTFGRRGNLIRTNTVCVSEDSFYGARVPEGWYLFTRVTGGIEIAFHAEESEGCPPSWSRILSLEATEQVFLATFASDVLLAKSEYPYEVVRATPLGTSEVLFDGADLGLDTVWRALGAHRVGDLYLQTMADATSDRRLLVLRDEAGTLVRRREVELPLGFAAASEEEELLAAVTNINERALVVYRWSRLGGNGGEH